MPQNTMAAGAVVLLLLAQLGIASAGTNYYGRSIRFTRVQENENGTFEVNFNYRSNSRDSCGNEQAFGGSNTVQTDQDNSGQNKWCQAEGDGTATIQSAKSLTLSESGCCWALNVNGKINWNAQAEVSLGTRSDTLTFNQPPVTATVASLRLPQNCFAGLPLLAYDPDGDHVRCRFTANAKADANVTLDENKCTLQAMGHLTVGVHAFELVLEDQPTDDVTLIFADGTSSARKAFNMSSSNNSLPFSQVPLQFVLEILPPVPICVAGHVKPQFLSQTPSQGEVKHAVVGQQFHLHVEAQAAHANIYNFQVSGPLNMTKEFKDKEFGKAQVTLTWTPSPSHLHQNIPLCFTAETNESQSEMRCVIIKVTKTPPLTGIAFVTCTANTMTVVLEKASMPGIDKRWLQLRDPSCSLTSNVTHIMGIMSLSTCGTKVEDKGDFIVYENEINSFELAHTIITRRRRVKIDFYCQFPKTVSISNHYQLGKSDYIFTESSFGSFGYAFDIFKDVNYTQKVEANAYPVEVKLLEMIYMGIQAQSDLPAVTLFVESCKATPEDNPQSSLSYDLIKNGCMKDETLKVHSSDPTSFKFEVQAFKFSGNFEQVYITCSVMLCETGNLFSRCAQGCLNNPPRRRRRGVGMETASHYITQGPMRVVRQADPKAADDKKRPIVPIAANTGGDEVAGGDEVPVTARAALSTNLSTMVFAGLFIVMVIALAVVVGYFARKTKPDDLNALLVPDSEN